MKKQGLFFLLLVNVIFARAMEYRPNSMNFSAWNSDGLSAAGGVHRNATWSDSSSVESHDHSELAEWKKRHHKIYKQVQWLLAANDAFVARHEEDERLCAHLNKSVKDLSAQNKNFARENSKLRRQLSSQVGREGDLQRARDAAIRKSQVHKQAYDKMKAKYDACARECQRLQEDKAYLLQQLNHASHQEELYRSTIRKLRQELDEAKRSVCMDEETALYAAAYEKKCRENQMLAQRVVDCKKKVDYLTEEIATLRLVTQEDLLQVNLRRVEGAKKK